MWVESLRIKRTNNSNTAPADYIHTHDSYTLGEFKDDQVQNHKHESLVIAAGYPNGSGNYPRGVDWKDITSKTTTELMNYQNNTSGRHGDVTRGKRKGVNYIIKVL